MPLTQRALSDVPDAMTAPKPAPALSFDNRLGLLTRLCQQWRDCWVILDRVMVIRAALLLNRSEQLTSMVV